VSIARESRKPSSTNTKMLKGSIFHVMKLLGLRVLSVTVCLLMHVVLVRRWLLTLSDVFML
jgi:hypothetical protein